MIQNAIFLDLNNYYVNSILNRVVYLPWVLRICTIHCMCAIRNISLCCVIEANIRHPATPCFISRTTIHVSLYEIGLTVSEGKSYFVSKARETIEERLITRGDSSLSDKYVILLNRMEDRLIRMITSGVHGPAACSLDRASCTVIRLWK